MKTKLAMLIMILFFPVALVAAEQEVLFLDSNLESVVRSVLELPSGEITVEDMESLTELDAYGKYITSLEGLQAGKNLVFLDLGWNNISSLDPLAELISLEQLYLDHNQIADITPLKGLTNLRGLRISENFVTSLEPLESMVHLEELLVGNNYMVIDFSNSTPDFQGRQNGIFLEYLLAQNTNMTNYNGQNYTEGNVVYGTPQEDNLRFVPAVPAEEVSGKVPVIDTPVAKEYSEIAPVAEIEEPVVTSAEVEEVVVESTPATLLEPATEVAPVEEVVAEVVEPAVISAEVVEEAVVESIPATPLEPAIEVTPVEEVIAEVVEPVVTSAEVVAATLLNPSDIHPSLRAALAKKLRVGEDELTAELLSSVEVLDISYMNVRSLSGIETLPNLVVLMGEGNSIQDLSPLAELEHIRYISLPMNRVTSIEPLVSMDTIEYLNLSQNMITDFSSLNTWESAPASFLRDDNPGSFSGGMSVEFYDDNLRTEMLLYFYEDTEPQPITQKMMLGVEELYLFSSDIVSIEGLQYAKNLKILDLGGNPISDISILSQLEKLDTLHIDDTRVVDISPLNQIPSLRTLDISGVYNGVTQLSSLRKIQNLTVDNTNLSSLNFMVNMPQLRYLSARDNRIEHIDLSGTHKSLHTLLLDENYIRNINFSDNLPALSNLSVNNNRLEFVEGLEFLPALEVLSLSGNLMEGPVQLSLPKLRALDLSSNNIESFTVSGSPLLETVNISENNIDRVTLSSSIQTLEIQGNALTSLSMIKGFTQLEYLDITNNGLVVDFNSDSDTNGNTLRELLTQEDAPFVLYQAGNTVVGLPPIKIVPFLDSELEENVMSVLEITGDGITPEELTELETFYYQYGYVYNLWGLEYATSLTSLDLYYNEITDIEALVGHPTLEYLNLGLNDIRDISVLTTIPNLKVVNIAENQMVIDFTSNDVGSQGYKNGRVVQELLTNGVQLIDEYGNDYTYDNTIIGSPFVISVDGSLLLVPEVGSSEATPEEQFLANEPLSSGIASVMEHQGLTSYDEVISLDLYDYGIESLRGIELFVNLQTLDLGGNSVEDLSPLAELNSLKTLYVDHNNISDITVLSGITSLEHLFLHNNSITDLTPLQDLDNLITLGVGYNNCDIDFTEEGSEIARGNGDTIRILRERGVLLNLSEKNGFRYGNSVTGTP